MFLRNWAVAEPRKDVLAMCRPPRYGRLALERGP